MSTQVWSVLGTLVAAAIAGTWKGLWSRLLRAGWRLQWPVTRSPRAFGSPQQARQAAERAEEHLDQEAALG